MRYFVRQKAEKKFERESPFQLRDGIGRSQAVIQFELTGQTFEGQAVISQAVISDAAMKGRNQIAIQVSLYLWRFPKARRDCDHYFLKSLGGLGAVVQLPFDMAKGPRPQSFRDFMDTRIDRAVLLIRGSNPEWRNPACFRAEHPVLCFRDSPSTPCESLIPDDPSPEIRSRRLYRNKGGELRKVLNNFDARHASLISSKWATGPVFRSPPKGRQINALAIDHVLVAVLPT